jgi:hypothetical protein
MGAWDSRASASTPASSAASIPRTTITPGSAREFNRPSRHRIRPCSASASAEASDVLYLHPARPDTFAGETVDSTSILIRFGFIADVRHERRR